MHYINLKTWKRKKHYDFFRKFKQPHFNICTELEITETYKYTRKNKLSIFTSILFAVMKTCNHFEFFRYRIKGSKVAVHDTVHPGITVLVDDDLYSNCIFDYKDNFIKFTDGYKKALVKVKKKINVDKGQKGRDDLIFISALPWISFTSVTNPMPGNPDDSIPRIIWGKHFKKDNKIMVSISIQVHHALMDGVHAGKFLLYLTELLKEPKKLF
jgi:chloramphenicol O-acetyltransferase type A